MFRSLLTILLLSCLLPSGMQAQENETRLQQAAEAYAAGDYQTAIDLYEQVLAGGQYAFEVYYNLGNAYFKSGQIAPAILHYERAARIDPSDADLQYNLAMAQSRTVDKVEHLPVPELISGYKSFVNGTASDKWGLFSILSFVCMLAAAGIFLFTGQKGVKQVSLVAGILFLILTGMFLLFGSQQQHWLDNQKEAVIFKPSITVTSTPDSTGEALFVLHEGTKVRVVERFRDWIRIRIGDGNTGWVPVQAAEEI